MKIRGRPGEVTASDYAKELAEVLTQRIAMSLPQGDDIVRLDPNEVAKSMESLIVYEPQRVRTPWLTCWLSTGQVLGCVRRSVSARDRRWIRVAGTAPSWASRAQTEMCSTRSSSSTAALTDRWK